MLDPDKQKELNAALIECAKSHAPEELKRLIAQGADINAQRPNFPGFTALRISAARSQWDNMKCLLAMGADTTPRCRNNHTAFHAALCGLEEAYLIIGPVMEAFIAKGAEDLNELDSNGWRPVILALMEGHIEIAQKMIAAGADINLLSSTDETGLMCVVKLGRFKPTTLKWMLEHGADPAQKNAAGQSVLDMVTEREILSVFQDHARKLAQERKDKINTAVSRVQSTATPLKTVKLRPRKPPGHGR